MTAAVGTRRYPYTGDYIEVWNGKNWSRLMNHEQPRYTEAQQKLIYQAIRQLWRSFPPGDPAREECVDIMDGLVPFVYTQRQEQPT